MGIKKVKISELPLSEDLTGLSTIGVDRENKSVRVSLEFVKTACDSATKAAADADRAASNATTEAEKATTAATKADEAASEVHLAAANADNAAGVAYQAAEEAHISSEMARIIRPGSVCVDKIRACDMDDAGSGQTYSMLSLNRPNNYLQYIGGDHFPLLPLFECRYRPDRYGDTAETIISSCVSKTGYGGLSIRTDYDQQGGVLRNPIQIHISELVVPPKINAGEYRKLYIRELTNNAEVEITELSETKTLIKTDSYQLINRASFFNIDDNTRFVTLNIRYGSCCICTKFSVFCSNISYESYFDPIPNYSEPTYQGKLYRVSKGKFEIVKLPDSVRYIQEKSGRRIFDRFEQRFISECMDVRDYVEVLYKKAITTDPYDAVRLIGKPPVRGKIGIFIHKKWRQRAFRKDDMSGIEHSSRNCSKFSLAQRGRDQLPDAAAAYKFDPASVSGKKLCHRYFATGGTTNRSMRYISCFVSLYETPTPHFESKGRRQPKILIGTPIYFRLCNRIFIYSEGNGKRAWVVEQ